MSEARRIDNWDDAEGGWSGHAGRVTVPMTVAEFRRWVDGQPGRWELVDGQPRAMSPASTTRGSIQTQAAVLIGSHLNASQNPCRAITEAAVVPTSFRRSNARAADLAITCAPPERDGWEINEPVVILEMLSPFNEQDTRNNVWAYMTIPSVQQVLLLHSTAIRGEIFERQADGLWPEEPTPLTLGATVRIEAIGFDCPLAEFYARTALALPPVG